MAKVIFSLYNLKDRRLTPSILILGTVMTIGHVLGAELAHAIGEAPIQVQSTYSQTHHQTSLNREVRLIAQFDGILRRGDSGDAVEALQRALGRNGLLSSSQFNGVYGPATEQAVRTFQRIRELPVTGAADSETLNALNVDISRYGPALAHPELGTLSTDRLTVGDRGADVSVLQRALGDVGLSVGVDGVYGGETQQAVRTYQQVRGLPVTGTADFETLSGLGFSRYDGPLGSFNGSDSTTAGSYVTTIVGSNDELPYIQGLYPNAQLVSTRRGDIIVLGRFSTRSSADNLSWDASQRGFDSRVMHSREL